MDLEVRIEQLERRQRGIVWSVLAGGLLCIAAIGAANGPQSFDWVDTKRLTVRDEQGKVRAFIAATPKGNVSLSLIDENGKLCAVFGVTSDAKPSLELSDGDKTMRARLALDSDGKPYLEFYDAAGKVIRREP